MEEDTSTTDKYKIFGGILHATPIDETQAEITNPLYLKAVEVADAILQMRKLQAIKKRIRETDPMVIAFMASPVLDIISKYINYDINELLIEAIMRNNIESVRFFLQLGPQPNHDKCMPMRTACAYASLDIIKLLHTQYGASLNNGRENLLVISAKRSHIDIMQYLLENGADVNADDGEALSYAVSNNNLELAKLLITFGNELHHNRIVKSAIKHGSVDMLELLISHGMVLYYNKDTLKIMSYAIAHNTLDMIKHLHIKYKCKLTSYHLDFPGIYTRKNSIEILTYIFSVIVVDYEILGKVLMCAAKASNRVVMDFAIDRGAIITELEMYKIHQIKFEDVKYLHEKGVINDRYLAGIFNQRQYIILNNDTRYLKYLIENAKDRTLIDNGTIMCAACCYWSVPTMKTLLECKLDVNKKPNEYSQYPLTIVISKQCSPLYDLLIEHGADIHANDDEALIEAFDKNCFNIVKNLLERGANIHARDDYILKNMPYQYDRWSKNAMNELIINTLAKNLKKI